MHFHPLSILHAHCLWSTINVRLIFFIKTGQAHSVLQIEGTLLCLLGFYFFPLKNGFGERAFNSYFSFFTLKNTFTNEYFI